MKLTSILMLALLLGALAVHPSALDTMQLASIEEWETPYGYVNLYRVLRVVGPIIVGMWVMWRTHATGWARVRLFGLMLAGGVLGLVSLYY